MVYSLIKTKICINDVNELLQDVFKSSVKQVEEVTSGKIKAVYFFNYKDKNYVVRFSKDDMEFKFESYLQKTLEGEDFPLAKLLFTGCFNNYYYAISEKIQGVTINNLSKKELNDAMPSVMTALTKLHSIDITSSIGYGWFDENKNGSFNTFTEFLEGFFSKEIEGFWKGWYDLFENSFLDYEVFNVLYKKMLELAPCCEGRRHITHTDFHFHNVIINDSKINGIIDWGRVSYLDFMFDVATLVMEFPDCNLLQCFQEFYISQKISVANMNERFLCAAICNSLDGMRFWAKLGHENSYKGTLNNIITTLSKHGISLECLRREQEYRQMNTVIYRRPL